jgi:hypothetical protein
MNLQFHSLFLEEGRSCDMQRNLRKRLPSESGEAVYIKMPAISIFSCSSSKLLYMRSLRAAEE